jgi:DNA-binding transcriptional regulator YdaS (Cro superfamily)
MEIKELPGIEQAINAAGSQYALAAMLGCTQQNVSFWKGQGYAPLARAVEIEQCTGVPRSKLINPKVIDLLDTNV